jgi:uncharacterized repeat protein (TIGR02543 family)
LARYVTRGVLVTALSVSLIVGVAGPASAAAVSVVVDGITFTADDANIPAGASATNYTPGPVVVVIPSNVVIAAQNYAVTSIGIDAFRNNGLTSVSIPVGVTSVGTGAFMSNFLTTVVLPSSVSVIGANAFRNNDVQSVSLPVGVTSIGASAFMSNNIVSVSIPDTVTVINAEVFRSNDLTSVSLPSGLVSIGSQAFMSNDLTSLSIPGGVTQIGSEAFRGNDLTTLTIPSAMASVGTSAFFGNPLTAVDFLGSAPAVGATIFGTSDPLVSYPWRRGAGNEPGGYTTPTWQGYRTQAIADVAFSTLGGSTAPPGQRIVLGATVAEPPDPTRTGYAFEGWFAAESGGTVWDFSAPLTDASLSTVNPADLTLYARWVKSTLADTGADLTVPLGVGVGLVVAGFVALTGRVRRTRASDLMR